MKTKDIELLCLQGRVDTSSSEHILRIITAATANQPKILLLDMQEVSFIDSKGLGTIIAALKHVRVWGGKIAICAPQIQVRNLFELTNLTKITRIFPDRDRFFQEMASQHEVSD